MPCICIRSNSILRHKQSHQHKEAMELEEARVQSEKDGGIVSVLKKSGKLKKIH